MILKLTRTLLPLARCDVMSRCHGKTLLTLLSPQESSKIRSSVRSSVCGEVPQKRSGGRLQ
jgi:hypothetical protein